MLSLVHADESVAVALNSSDSPESCWGRAADSVELAVAELVAQAVLDSTAGRCCIAAAVAGSDHNSPVAVQSQVAVDKLAVPLVGDKAADIAVVDFAMAIEAETVASAGRTDSDSSWAAECLVESCAEEFEVVEVGVVDNSDAVATAGDSVAGHTAVAVDWEEVAHSHSAWAMAAAVGCAADKRVGRAMACWSAVGAVAIAEAHWAERSVDSALASRSAVGLE